MSEHRYDIRISEAEIDPNPLRVERQDPDNFPRLQTQERCALEIAAYVFKRPLKIDKTKILMIDYHLMQVKSIAECSPLEHSAILLTCIK